MAMLSASISLEIEDPSIFERFLALYAAIGCTGLQGIWRRPIDLNQREVGGVLRRVQAAGLRFDSVHGSFGDDLDLSTPDETVRLQTVLTHERDAEFAGALGGSLVVVHPSCCIPPDEGLAWSCRIANHQPSLKKNGASKTNGLGWGEAIDRVREPLLLDSLEKLAGIGEEMEIIFALENVPGYLWYGNHSQHLATLIRRIDSPYLQMCFDTGHAQLEARHFGTVAAQLAACLDVVGYLHLHDNDGLHDTHLVPGVAGAVIDWDEVAAVRRAAPCELVWMLELFGSIDELEHSLRTDNAVSDRLGRLLDL